MQNKPTPAPIFNYRKRPRQAVFADPQTDHVPGPSGAAAVTSPPSAPKFSDLMPPQGSGYGRGQHPPSIQGPPPRNSNVPNRLTCAAPRGGMNQGTYRKSTPTTSTYNAGTQKFQTNSNQFNSMQQSNTYPSNRAQTYNPRPATGVRFQAGNQQPYSGPSTSGQRMQRTNNPGPITSGQRMQRPNNPGPYGDMGPNMPSSSNTHYTKQHTENMIVAGRNTAVNRGVQYNVQPQPSARQTYTFKNTDQADTLTSDGVVKPPTSTKNQQINSKTSGSDFEKGLHAITCNVAGLGRWNKFKDNIQLLFEVYGYLDSAVTKQGLDCREFLLRDERKDAVKCAFFEIDRQLPKLTRGQWIRCVGTLNSKTDTLKVVSIRQVHDIEKRLSRMLINKSEETMHRLTRNLRES